MRPPDALLVAAAATFAAAATVAAVADGPLPRWFQARRFAVLLIAIAVLNIGLTLTVVVVPNKLAGAVLLGSALLLVYAAHRRLRAAPVVRPPGRRDPKR